MVKDDREYRAIVTEFRASTEADSYIVEGYATTFDDPYVMYSDGDVDYKESISSKAFDSADMSDVVFLYNHEGMVFARQKNGTLELSLDEHGLKVRANLGSTGASRDMYDAIKAGLVNQMSWAFSINADEYNKKTRTRTITGIKKVYDVSAVSIPANPATEISARDYFNGVIEIDKAERLAQEQERRRLELRLQIEEI